MTDKITFQPIGLSEPVTLEILEDQRPSCCPDRSCRPFYVPIGQQENLDKGFSGACWGVLQSPLTFKYREAEHHNDLSYCSITPLKGLIRYFVNSLDFMSDMFVNSRVAWALFKRVCQECGVASDIQTLTIYSKRGKDSKDLTLCLGCAVRLNVVQYHPENAGKPGTMKYW